MLLVIAHNHIDGKPPKEALEHFGGAKFRHFHCANPFQGYRYFAQVDVAGSENLGVTRPEQLQWVEFNGYKIGG